MRVSFLVFGLGAQLAWAGESLRFDVEHLQVEGNVRHVDAVDLDGDGKLDLLAIIVTGEGDKAERTLGVFWNKGGSFSKKPDLVLKVAKDVCVYELAEVDERPGAELIEVTAQGLRSRSWANRVAGPSLELVNQATLFLRPPKDQLHRFRLAQRLGGNALSLLVPGPLGTLSVYGKGDESWSRRVELEVDLTTSVDVSSRAESDTRPENDVARAGLSSFSVTTRFPELRVLDLNGDGRPDIALVEDDTVRGYLQTAEGSFAPGKSFEHTFGVRTPKELNEKQVEVRTTLSDLDGDGRADAIVSKQVSEGLSSAKTTVSIFYATATGFAAKADQTIETDGAAFGAVLVADVDGDGKPDLVMNSVHMGLGAIIRILTTSTLKVGFQLHTIDDKKHFTKEPTAERDLAFKLDLDKGGSDLQAVDMFGDYDGDGKIDFAFGTGPEELSLFRGGVKGALFSDDPIATVRVRAFGALLPVSLEGAKPTDIVLWYPSTTGHKNEISVVHSRSTH